MTIPRIVASLVVTLIAAASFSSIVSAGGPTATRQRVAILEKVSLSGGKSTFELVPLSAGPLTHDSGRVDPSGEFTGWITRDGLRVEVGSGIDTMTGAHGSFRVTQFIQHAPVVGGYYIDTGKWSFGAGTGGYVKVTGTGRLVGILLPSQKVLYRQEGFVTNR
jgi:hypothetical protein